MRTRRAESGQIMPIVGLLMVVIIGMAAFAIDGSNTYAQHRRLQADLDVAVRVAAAKMFDFNQYSPAYTSTAQTAIQAAAQILQQDGYPNAIVNATYSSAHMIVSPLGVGLCGVDDSVGIKICTPPITSSSPFYGRTDYVEGFLTPYVSGFFGGVLGLGRTKISVRAVAWHGGAHEPFAIIGLDPSGCSAQVQDAASTLITHGSIHANGTTCLANNGTGTVTGISESVMTSTSPITGQLGTQNGGASIIDNPYSPTVSLPAVAAIRICSSGCTATSFTDPALPTWARGDGSSSTSCYSHLKTIDPTLSVTPPSGVTYYLPPDAPNSTSLPWGSTAQVNSFSATGGEFDFFPHCDDAQTSAIYYFTGSPDDMVTHSGPTINSFNTAFVMDPCFGASSPCSGSNGYLIHSNGNSGDKWVLNAPMNGPLQGIAIYENQPCSTSTAQPMTLNGSASSIINGIVDVACADLTVTGNSTNTSPFVNGVIVGWDVTAAGHGTAVVDYNPSGAPPDKGSVLVE